VGQKTNPNILRVGLMHNWKSKYFEKKPVEHSICVFKDLEIKKYINQFFKNNGLIVHSIRLNFNENSLHIFVSYFLTFRAILLARVVTSTQKLKLTLERCRRKKRLKKKVKSIRKFARRYLFYQKRNYLKIVKKCTIKKSIKRIKELIKNRKIRNKERRRIKKIRRQEERVRNMWRRPWHRPWYKKKQRRSLLKVKRYRILRAHKKYLPRKIYKTVTNVKANFFLEKFFEGLNLFLSKKIHVFFTLKQLNKDVKKLVTKKKKNYFRKILPKLRKYQRNRFFIEGVNILFTSVVNSNSAAFLAEYIAQQLRKLKRPKYFLFFLKATLTKFYKHEFSCIQGVRIKIKGRFNGAPRARSREVRVGKAVPVLTIESEINYSEATSYTNNGTFGVKVWIFNKSKDPCLKNQKKIGLKKLKKGN
jgi:ribosomal protein S3